MTDFLHLLEGILPYFKSPFGAVFFIPFYAIWVTLLLPGLWLTMLAGAIYGTWFGSLLVFVGACLGAEISFFLGRTKLREWVRERLARWPKLQTVEMAVNKEGLKFILLTRLSPAFPFSFLNLVYGLTDVSFVDYSVGLIGIIPGTLFFCSLGALAGDIARFQEVLLDSPDLISWGLRFVGLLSTVAVAWIIIRSARTVLED